VSERAPFVGLIHSTPAAIAPATAALRSELDGVRLWNLLDDRLIADAEEAGALIPRLQHRMMTLVRYAFEGGVDAVLMTCSQYGSVAPSAREELGRPVYGSDEAMFDRIAAGGDAAVGLLASLEDTRRDSTTRLEAAIARRGSQVQVRGVTADGASEAAARGDHVALADRLEAAARSLGDDIPSFALAQYSLTPVADELTARLGRPVLSPTGLAAAGIRSAIGARAAVSQ